MVLTVRKYLKVSDPSSMGNTHIISPGPVQTLRWTQKYHRCPALDPEPADGWLLVYMVWCCPLSSMWSGPGGRGESLSDGALYSGSQHEALSTHKDNSGPAYPCLRPRPGPLWGGQMWCLHRCVGPKLRGQTSSTPLVVLAHPWPDWEGWSLLWLQIGSHHGWHDLKGQSWASDPVCGGSHMEMSVQLEYF